MSSEDDWKAKVEIIPPGEKSRELEPREEARHLPEIALPPRGVIKSALLTALRYKTTETALRAYRAAIREAVGATGALDDLDHARLQRERTLRLLEDAESIHQDDADHRRTKRIGTEQALKDAEADAEIKDMERQRKLQRERDKHEQWEEKQRGESGPDLAERSEEEEEFATELEAASEKHRRSAQQPRFEEIRDAIIARIIADYGGEENLTPEANEHIKRVREEAEELIRDREPT